MKSPIITTFGLLASFFTIGAAQASVITIAGTEYIRPYAVTSTSTLNGLPDWNPNSHRFLIDGSGINTTTGKGDGRATSQWLSAPTISPTIVFDLGSPFDLRGTHVWNMWLDPAIYSGSQGDYAWAYGVNGLTLSTSVDGTSFSTGTHFNFTAATLGADDVGQDYLFVANGVRYVKFVIDANPNNNFTWVGNRNTQYYTGLQEVVFMAAPVAVPEPGSLLVLGKFGGGRDIAAHAAPQHLGSMLGFLPHYQPPFPRPPAQRLFQEPIAESKFLAVSQIPSSQPNS